MKQMKDKLIDSINAMTEENLKSTREDINKLFDFMELAQSIWGSVPEISFPKPIEKTVEPIVSTIEEPLVPVEALATTREPYPSLLKIGELQRKLRGGIVEIDNKTFIVSESWIRHNGIVHGDWIEVYEQSALQNIYVKHKDSTTAHKSNRVEIDYCLLERSTDGLLVANKQIVNGGIQTIKLDGETPFQFLIIDRDIEKRGLKEGDVVVIAYMSNNPVYHGVAWHYHDFTNEAVLPTPKPSSYYKENNNEKLPLWNKSELEVINGKKIVIVGAEFRFADFKALGPEANLTITSMTGNEAATRIKATIRDVDLILSASEHGGHRGMKLAKKYAKQFNIPVRNTPTSQSSVKKAIVHGIKDSYIPFYSFF